MNALDCAATLCALLDSVAAAAASAATASSCYA